MVGVSGRVPLAAAIEALRSELAVAVEAGAGKQVKLRVEALELTLEAAVTDAGTASGGIKWWLIDAGAEVSRESVATQRVTLKLTPLDGATGPNPRPLVLEG